jgi:hypothetical protein
MPIQNVVFWNTIVLGHVKYGEGQKARYGIKHYHVIRGFSSDGIQDRCANNTDYTQHSQVSIEAHFFGQSYFYLNIKYLHLHQLEIVLI